MSDLAFLSLVNDRAQFDACQASLRDQAQPFPEWLMVEPNRHGWNAAQGLNHGIERLDAQWIVCVHQDVLFPDGFWQRLTKALAALDEDVAVAGIVGCERSGRFHGHIYDPNGHCYWSSLPHDVLAVDEVLIALRKSSGLRFCEEVPGFHCYGADLCFEAEARGLRTVAIDAPLVHLSSGKLDVHYERASKWLMAKWGERYGHMLPMPTLLLQDPARANWWHRFRVRLRKRIDCRARNKNRCPDPQCSTLALGDRRGVGRRA
ncbi:MAG: glycosyltransferase [Planctomycetota bacterium]